DDFPITEAQLWGLFLESIAYGIYLVTVAYCAQALLRSSAGWKRLDEINWSMVIVAILLFCLASLDLMFGFYNNLKAFITFGNIKDGALNEFTDISSWVNVMKSVTLVVQTMIGDGILVYRCWVVYNKSWLLTGFSFILWLGGVFCTIYIIYIESTLHTKALVNSSKLAPVITAFWSITISLNIITTALLVARIWKADRDNNAYGIHSSSTGYTHRPSALKNVMRSVIESGLLYTVTAFISFVVYIVGSTAAYPVTDVEVQIIGIAFNLIIIR
ncbi:hypothetical protein BDQ12DRAFT_582127, partial [Crucibulum laeve]